MKNCYLKMVPLAAITITLLALTACSQNRITTEIPAENTPNPSSTIQAIESVPPTPSEISLTDGLGNSITLQNPAQRIVSLAPSNTELLFALGAGGQVVGRDSFSDYPEEAQKIPDLGSGYDGVNIEAILAQKPDLVLAADLTPPEDIKSLQDAGLTVYALPNPNNFEELFANIETVSILTGRQTEAKAQVEALNTRKQAVLDKLAGLEERPLVFYELDGTDPSAPWTAGPGNFIDHLIDLAGGENLGAGLQGEWVQISIEELIDRQPDIILLGDATYGGVTPKDVQTRTNWDALEAVKQAQIFVFDDNLVSRPGPRLMDGLESMAKLLHPELFEP